MFNNQCCNIKLISEKDATGCSSLIYTNSKPLYQFYFVGHQIHNTAVGKAIFPCGAVYEGTMKDMKFDGFGVLTLPNHEIYEGIFFDLICCTIVNDTKKYNYSVPLYTYLSFNHGIQVDYSF